MSLNLFLTFALLPSKGVPFPPNFMQCAKTILKRLFRVYAHIYHEHFSHVVDLMEQAHLNTSFKHFIFFVQEFNLIDKRELAPLQELIETLTERDYQNYPTNNLSKREQLQLLSQQNINDQINNQLNGGSQLAHIQQQLTTNQPTGQDPQSKCQISVPAKDQLLESTSSATNSLNSVITSSLTDEPTKPDQYSSSNSRASSSNKLEDNNAYF